jgi:DNA repair protein RecN (Recombination protein N)
MITFLEIENILLIKKTEIEFKKGLCVLTGETGAGKSIILNSILFLLGKKIKTDAKNLVREDAEKGSISGCFDISSNSALKMFLHEKGFEIGDELIIKRNISKLEKERAFLNGSLVSSSILSEIGNLLIEVNRQNEQIGLLETSSHLKILDLYAEAGSELSLVENAYKELSEIRNEIKETENLLEKFKNEKDYLESLVSEIESLELEENEESILSDKKLEISKALKEVQSVNEVIQKLFYEKNVRSSFVSAMKALSGKNGTETNQFELTIERILNEIDGLEESLVAYTKDKNYTEYDLDKINDRLFLIRDIARKYKVKPEELTSFLASQKAILNQINFSDEKIRTLRKKEEEAVLKYRASANVLSQKRKAAALKLEEQINSEFLDLEMKGADFKVFFKEDDLKESSTGSDSPQFLVSTNVGSKHSPLAKVASGGELSRLLLAIKIALLKVNMLETVIFDEIDAGIGGKTSVAVGMKLKELSKSVQVILITHQAQIAAKTDVHLKIQKKDIGGTVETSVKQLNLTEREEEIARMLSGEVSKESLENARKMLTNF